MLKYLSVILISSLLACNPVKKVLKDPVKFDKVAEEVIRRGKCTVDTVTVTEVKDSVVYKDSIIETVKNIPCKDFDTTIGRARIKVSSGVLSYSAKDSVVYRTKTVTNTVTDRSLEKILRKDIAKQDSTIKRKDLDLRGAELRAKELQRDLDWAAFKFWLLFVSALVIIFRKRIIWLFSKL